MARVGVWRVAKIALATTSLGALGGCFHVSQRALANGRQLGYSTTEEVIYGQRNPAAQRQLYNRLQSSAFGYQYTPPRYWPAFKR